MRNIVFNNLCEKTDSLFAFNDLITKYNKILHTSFKENIMDVIDNMSMDEKNKSLNEMLYTDSFVIPIFLVNLSWNTINIALDIIKVKELESIY